MKDKIFWQEKRHTASRQVITDDKKQIQAIGPAHHGSEHDKRIYNETRIARPPGVLALGDLGYMRTTLEIPLKTSKKKPLTKAELEYNTWHSKLRIGV